MNRLPNGIEVVPLPGANVDVLGARPSKGMADQITIVSKLGLRRSGISIRQT
jgi:hypothetical protein